MYEVLKLVRALNLFIPCQLDLFNKMVKLVLLYRWKKWGYGNCKIIERVYLIFCNFLLHIKTSTPLLMIYCKLDPYPLEIDIKIHDVISYWLMVNNQNFPMLFIIYLSSCLTHNARTLYGWLFGKTFNFQSYFNIFHFLNIYFFLNKEQKCWLTIVCPCIIIQNLYFHSLIHFVFKIYLAHKQLMRTTFINPYCYITLMCKINIWRFVAM
jgi:hypothetical protein